MEGKIKLVGPLELSLFISPSLLPQDFAFGIWIVDTVTKPWPGGPSSLQAADFCFPPGNWDHFSKSGCILVPKSWVGGLDQEMRAPENQLTAVLGLKSMSGAHPLTPKSAFVKQLKTGPTAELVKKL